MAWLILAVALVLALALWLDVRRHHRGTRRGSPDHRDVGPDEMRTRVEGDFAWGDPLRDRYRRP